MLAARFGDLAAAAKLYPLLAPYGHRIVTVGAWLRLQRVRGARARPACDDARRPAGATRTSSRRCERNDALGAVVLAAAARQALAGVLDDEARAERLRHEADTAIAMTLPDGVLWRL